MREKHFLSNDKVIATVDEHFADFPEIHYRIFIIFYLAKLYYVAKYK